MAVVETMVEMRKKEKTLQLLGAPAGGFSKVVQTLKRGYPLEQPLSF
jgi:hypothetical protein